jgi:hypothetical protein
MIANYSGAAALNLFFISTVLRRSRPMSPLGQKATSAGD